MAHDIAGHHSTHHAGSLKGFKGTFVVMFIAFLAVAVVLTLVAQDWRAFLPGAEGARSMFDGVKRAVYTVISQLN